MSDFKNAEGYTDNTACKAIEHIDSKERAKLLIAEIQNLCFESGFELVDPIKLYNRKTGRVYK